MSSSAQFFQTLSTSSSIVCLSNRYIFEDELRDCPILFLANKQDLENAMSSEYITEQLDLHRLRNRIWCKLHNIKETLPSLQLNKFNFSCFVPSAFRKPSTPVPHKLTHKKLLLPQKKPMHLFLRYRHSSHLCDNR